jgi:hypothetical protein
VETTARVLTILNPARVPLSELDPLSAQVQRVIELKAVSQASQFTMGTGR